MGDVIGAMLQGIPIPQMAAVRQVFASDCLPDVEQAVREELAKLPGRCRLERGMDVAIAVGSRGVDQIPSVVRATVETLKEWGACPFIVPAMGSHGGATAKGQEEVLRHLGVCEDTVGAPIRSSMDVEQLGVLPNGLPIYVDRLAARAQGIVVINRVKPHTAFRGPIESGLMKMLSIGLGKQKGAEACHQLGFGHMAEHVPAMARLMMAKLPVLFGVATVENAYDRVWKVAAIPVEDIEEAEKELLIEATERMPRLWFDQIDVLVVDAIGKNISGDGMDPNVMGRFPTPYASGGPQVTKLVVLGLTQETEGNANGLGSADFTTRRVFEELDWEKTYANSLTSTVVAPTKIPMVLPDDRAAVQAAIKTSNILDFRQVRLVRIKNTLDIGEIQVSTVMLPEVHDHPQLEQITPPYTWVFDSP